MSPDGSGDETSEGPKSPARPDHVSLGFAQVGPSRRWIILAQALPRFLTEPPPLS
jgi:hypothetical protein